MYMSTRRAKSLPTRRISKKSVSQRRPKSEPISFKIPQPIYAPKDIELVVDNIEDTLDKLSKIGKEKGGINYRGYVKIAEVAYVAIINKFKRKCIPSYFSDRRHINLTINSNKKNTPILNDMYIFTNFGESIKDCIDRNVSIICIYLGLIFEGESSGHANLLIYRPFERIIERFEPHGKRYLNNLKADLSINKQLKELFEVKLNYYTNGKVTYFPPKEICPYKKGFQSLEGQIKGLHIEGGGFCAMWSLFIMEMILNNPTKPTKQIIEKVMEITNKDPQFLKDTIRGYVVGIERLLDHTFKIIDKTGFSFERAPFLFPNTDIIHSFIVDSIFQTKQDISKEHSYKSLPKSAEMDLYDKLMNLSREQLKQLTLKINKRLPLFVQNDNRSIEYIVDIIMTKYDEDIIEQFLPEVIMDVSKEPSV